MQIRLAVNSAVNKTLCVSTLFQPGLSQLASAGAALLRGRVGLLAHPASADRSGAHASSLLREKLKRRLVALYGPEHGFYGRGGAGEEISDERHPAWDIPIFSLYGKHRKPTAEMLAGIDTLVFDLQDIAVRCYTFVTTLRYVMEACAENGKRLIVCDRPVPLPTVVDGPLPEAGFESFVAGVPMPLLYGMTPGESARFLNRELALNLDLHVVPMRGYSRAAARGDWGPWISPSPGIRQWETAWTYPIAVFSEALSSLGCGRGGVEPFQVVTAAWMDAENCARAFNALRLPGLRAKPCWNPQPGIRFDVTQPERIRPFAATVQLLSLLQKMYGVEKVWGAAGTRPEWFDQLMGGPSVRMALLREDAATRIIATTAARLHRFRRARAAALLYTRTGP